MRPAKTLFLGNISTTLQIRKAGEAKAGIKESRLDGGEPSFVAGNKTAGLKRENGKVGLSSAGAKTPEGRDSRAQNDVFRRFLLTFWHVNR